MKRLDCLMDTTDLCDLVAFCINQGFRIFANNGQIIASEEEIIDFPDIVSFYVFPNTFNPPLKHSGSHIWIPHDTEGVSITKTLVSEKGLHIPGVISLNGNDETNKKIYSALARYCKATFHKTADSLLFVAPEMYKKWLSRMVSFDFFVEAEWFDVEQSSFRFSEFVANLEREGLFINENGCDIRMAQLPLEMKAEGYIIHAPDAKMHSWIAARKRYYFTDSEGVFLYMVKHKGKYFYRFIADKRHFTSDHLQNSVSSVYQKLMYIASGV